MKVEAEVGGAGHKQKEEPKWREQVEGRSEGNKWWNRSGGRREGREGKQSGRIAAGKVFERDCRNGERVKQDSWKLVNAE